MCDESYEEAYSNKQWGGHTYFSDANAIFWFWLMWFDNKYFSNNEVYILIMHFGSVFYK